MLNVQYSRDWYQATTQTAFLSLKKAELICATHTARGVHGHGAVLALGSCPALHNAVRKPRRSRDTAKPS